MYVPVVFYSSYPQLIKITTTIGIFKFATVDTKQSFS